jgi:hypothetical protein
MAQSVSSQSPLDTTLPPPPGKVNDVLTLAQVTSYLQTIFQWSNDLTSSMQFNLANLIVNTLSASKITSGTIGAQVIQIGNNIFIDGNLQQIYIKDNAGTTRVILGKLSATSTDWGIRAIDSGGTTRFQSGASTFIDGAIINNASIVGAALVNSTITGSKVASDGTSGIATANVNNNAISGFGQTTWANVNILSTLQVTMGSASIVVNSTTDAVLCSISGYAIMTASAAITTAALIRLNRGVTNIVAQEISLYTPGATGTTAYTMPYSFTFIDMGISGNITYTATGMVYSTANITTLAALGQLQVLDIKR